MFIGRSQELEALSGLWGKLSSSFVVCSGRRRVGKSTLVEEFAARSKCRFIEITGVAPDDGVTNETQLRHFCERLAAQTNTPEARVDGWAKAFDALAATVKGRARTSRTHGICCLRVATISCSWCVVRFPPGYATTFCARRRSWDASRFRFIWRRCRCGTAAHSGDRRAGVHQCATWWTCSA